MTQQVQGTKAQTFDDAIKNLPITEDDAKELGVDDDEDEKEKVDPRAIPAAVDGYPEWALLPTDLKIPPGKEVAFMLFRSEWTDAKVGDRQCILWPLTDADEKIAIKRVRGDSLRTLAEMSKQMIRAIDGHRVDWSGKNPKASLDRFWDEIGSGCRKLIENYHVKTHVLAPEEQADFFMNCLAVKTAVAG